MYCQHGEYRVITLIVISVVMLIKRKGEYLVKGISLSLFLVLNFHLARFFESRTVTRVPTLSAPFPLTRSTSYNYISVNACQCIRLVKDTRFCEINVLLTRTHGEHLPWKKQVGGSYKSRPWRALYFAFFFLLCISEYLSFRSGRRAHSSSMEKRWIHALRPR